MHLAELALEFSMDQLNSGANFLVKVFQGAVLSVFKCNARYIQSGRNTQA